MGDSFVNDLSSVDSKGLSCKTCEVLVKINKQSPDIAGGVHVGKEDLDVGAGDQGAFSGKDPTKVDRSAAYSCRQMAKSIVASGLAKRALVQLSYAIGVAKPLSLFVETYGSQKQGLKASDITNVVKMEFDA